MFTNRMRQQLSYRQFEQRNPASGPQHMPHPRTFMYSSVASSYTTTNTSSSPSSSSSFTPSPPLSSSSISDAADDVAPQYTATASPTINTTINFAPPPSPAASSGAASGATTSSTAPPIPAAQDYDMDNYVRIATAITTILGIPREYVSNIRDLVAASNAFLLDHIARRLSRTDPNWQFGPVNQNNQFYQWHYEDQPHNQSVTVHQNLLRTDAEGDPVVNPRARNPNPVLFDHHHQAPAPAPAPYPGPFQDPAPNYDPYQIPMYTRPPMNFAPVNDPAPAQMQEYYPGYGNLRTHGHWGPDLPQTYPQFHAQPHPQSFQHNHGFVDSYPELYATFPQPADIAEFAQVHGEIRRHRRRRERREQRERRARQQRALEEQLIREALEEQSIQRQIHDQRLQRQLYNQRLQRELNEQHELQQIEERQRAIEQLEQELRENPVRMHAEVQEQLSDLNRLRVHAEKLAHDLRRISDIIENASTAASGTEAEAGSANRGAPVAAAEVTSAEPADIRDPATFAETLSRGAPANFAGPANRNVPSNSAAGFTNSRAAPATTYNTAPFFADRHELANESLEEQPLPTTPTFEHGSHEFITNPTPEQEDVEMMFPQPQFGHELRGPPSVYDHDLGNDLSEAPFSTARRMILQATETMHEHRREQFFTEAVQPERADYSNVLRDPRLGNVAIRVNVNPSFLETVLNTVNLNNNNNGSGSGNGRSNSNINNDENSNNTVEASENTDITSSLIELHQT